MLGGEKPKILIVAIDEYSIDLFQSILSIHQIDFIDDHNCLDNPNWVADLDKTNDCDIIILTNLGIPFDIVYWQLQNIPRVREFNVIMISGCIDNAIRKACRAKRVKLIKAPFKISDILDAIDPILN